MSSLLCLRFLLIVWSQEQSSMSHFACTENKTQIKQNGLHFSSNSTFCSDFVVDENWPQIVTTDVGRCWVRSLWNRWCGHLIKTQQNIMMNIWLNHYGHHKLNTSSGEIVYTFFKERMPLIKKTGPWKEMSFWKGKDSGQVLNNFVGKCGLVCICALFRSLHSKSTCFRKRRLCGMQA